MKGIDLTIMGHVQNGARKTGPPSRRTTWA